MTGAQLDLDEELASARVGSFHKSLGILIALITLFDGYDTFNPAYVIHYVVQPWRLELGQAGFLVSSGLIGFLFGAIGHGAIADRLGRKGTLLAGLWIVNLFTAATALFAGSFWTFCLLRFLTGLGLGVLLPLGTTFINELAPKGISYTFSLWGVALGWSIGGMLAGLVGVFLTPLYGWQVLYFVGALSIPLTLVAHRVLPESPKFLAASGQIAELRELLRTLRPEREGIYTVATFRTPGAEDRRIGVGQLLSSRYLRTSLTLWLTAFMSLFTIFGLTAWIPTVMMQRGETFASSFGFGTLMLAMSFAGGLTLAEFADRKMSAAPFFLATWWLIGGLALPALAFFSGHNFNVVMVALASFFILGAQHVLNNFTASSYETDLRATGVGMMLGVGRIGAILGPFVAGMLQQATHGLDAMFWVLGCAAVMAAAAIASLRFGIAKASTQPQMAAAE